MFWFWIITTILSALLAPRPKDAEPGSMGDIQVPTAEEGRPIGYLCGTAKIQGPNVTWWGNLMVQPIEEETDGFLGIGSKKYTIGYKYFLGMQQALVCGAIDELIDIEVGGKSLSGAGASMRRSYSEGGVLIPISAPSLMGGEKLEGGIEGNLRFYFGSDTQEGNTYLTSSWGSQAPGFRGVCYAVLEGMYIGTQPYPKNWAWVLRRCPCPPGTQSYNANINGDGNAAHAIADLLTLPTEKGGMGLSAARLDFTSFNAAATTLKNEGLGVSIYMDQEQAADARIGEFLKIIDGVLYTDPQTGLWTLKLIRADYDPDTLPEFTENDFQGVPEIQRASWSETLNRIVVRYLDRAQNFTIRTVQERDAANRSIRGEEASGTIDYLMASNPAVAQVLAARERRTRSYPLATVSGSLNRKAHALRPGSPFKLSFAPLGIKGLICRVQTIRYGTLEAGQISITAVEDIFGVATATYTPPAVSGWVDPNTPPVAASQQALMEAPYWMTAENRHILAMAARADLLTQSMDIWADDGSGYKAAGTLAPCTPTGTLTGPWTCKTAAIDAAGFTIGSGTDLARLPALSTSAEGRLRGKNLALVGAEWVSWATATDNGDGTITITGVMRGVLDTVPADHPAGERVWFLSQGCAVLPGLNSSGGVGSQGPTGSTGPQGASFVWRGMWDPGVTYQAMDAVSRSGSSYVATQASLGQDPATSGAYWQLLAAKGDPGVSTFSRSTVSVIATAVAPGAASYVQMAVDTIADLLQVSTDYPAWVSVYGSANSRTADASRRITEDYATGSGVYLDCSTTDAKLSINLDPIPTFMNLDTTPADTAYLSIRNLGTVTRDITVTLVFLPCEA